MAVEIKVPSVGESVTEVLISQWMKKDGDYVEKGETIVELETDKINTELAAPESGILKLMAQAGSTLPVGAIVATVEPGAKPASANGAVPAKSIEEAPKPSAAAPAIASPAAYAPEASSGESPRPTSLASKAAEELGVDLKGVKGSGAAGRVVKEDVIAAAGKKPAAVPAPVPLAKAPAAPTGPRAETRERMSPLRKKIAIRLVEAQHTAAMLTTFNEVDMTAVMDVRAKYKESFQKKHGVGLGFMSFFVKATLEALRAYPRVNAFIENDEIVYHHYHDVGVAVGTEKGLVVPVIRNAENLDFAGVELAIRNYAEKAKAGKLTLDDLSGGTFTISNGGVYGSMMSTPILNPPQSGILGMHNIIKRPIAINDEVKIRPMMYLALSYDHRMVDGKEAVGFLVRIKECIESPERMLLDV